MLCLVAFILFSWERIKNREIKVYTNNSVRLFEKLAINLSWFKIDNLRIKILLTILCNQQNKCHYDSFNYNSADSKKGIQ